jgi:hypothetical protein
VKIDAVSDSRGKSPAVPTYKPGGLLKDTQIKRVTPKSPFLLDLEAKQRKLPSGVIEFHSKR